MHQGGPTFAPRLLQSCAEPARQAIQHCLPASLQALSNLSVQSWADFSRRLPPDYNAAVRRVGQRARPAAGVQPKQGERSCGGAPLCAHPTHPTPTPPPTPQTDTQHPPPSFEGGEQRCFASLLVCGRRFRPAKPLQWGLPQVCCEHP